METMEIAELAIKSEREILPYLNAENGFDSNKREKWRNKIRYSKNISDLRYNIQKINEIVNVGEVINKILNLTDDNRRETLLKAYNNLLDLIQTYIDIDEKYKKIIAIWIIGTYFHKQFETYPYLFLNAMRGSGKTRTLKLISSLIPNGKLIVSLNEAVLFRTAKHSSFCIDEFEGVGGKDKNALRELLNGAYKKGVGVERAKKVKIGNIEDYVIEKYDVFTPVAMANIWGMEDVLGDRCISVVLEKSERKDITKLCEDFSPSNPKIKEILDLFSVVSVDVESIKNIYRNWNNYYLTHTLTTHTTHTTHTTLTTLHDKFYNRLIETKVEGRHFELFLPLFISAYLIDEEILDDIINIAEEIVNEKKKEDIMMNKDMALYDFVSQRDLTLNYITIIDLLKDFREYLQQESDETRDWLNSQWMGRALRRLNLIIDKRRIARGVEVILNVEKAKNKMKYFRGESKE